MQDSAIVTRHRISGKLDEARQRLQRIRQGIKKPFRKAEPYSVEILDSPFRSYYSSPYESGPNEPALSLPYLQNIEAMSRLTPSPTLTDLSPTMDGAVEKRHLSSRSTPLGAIFVHAGAGYHSTTNEHIHLGACRE
jgi:taspase (threonine aspartase 1)